MISQAFRQNLENCAREVETYLDRHFAQGGDTAEALVVAARYSLLQKGAKRFRASLAQLTAQALGAPSQQVVPWAASVECIHAYSLIHDDLPCMDNDDFRRGEPTNHKVFGEATALLAGDALLTEAFSILAQAYSGQAAVALNLVAQLSRAAGMHGMISGQMRDIATATQPHSDISQLKLLHRQKTGALIAVSVAGAARLSGATADQQKHLELYAETLGLAFQVKDDILDHARNETASYTQLLGLDGAKKTLEDLTETAVGALKIFAALGEPLREMVQYNYTRES